MTQEEKQLLLKDLCARLPYGVKVHGVFLNYNKDKDKILYEECDGELNYENLKRYETLRPYLRPMSSMTEEEKKIYDDILTKMYYDEKSTLGDISDYLNSIHVDYRGLIERGLAIAVNENNNPY